MSSSTGSTNSSASCRPLSEQGAYSFLFETRHNVCEDNGSQDRIGLRVINLYKGRYVDLSTRPVRAWLR